MSLTIRHVGELDPARETALEAVCSDVSRDRQVSRKFIVMTLLQEDASFPTPMLVIGPEIVYEPGPRFYFHKDLFIAAQRLFGRAQIRGGGRVRCYRERPEGPVIAEFGGKSDAYGPYDPGIATDESAARIAARLGAEVRFTA
jgi:hypothetical protein